MKPLVQQERSGRGIASVAMVTGVHYQQSRRVAAAYVALSADSRGPLQGEPYDGHPWLA
jgi:hypothetical protein